MNKFYLIILFIGVTFFASAQESKSSEPSPSAEVVKARVLKFYPNPASSVINFEVIKSIQRDLTIQIYNFIGKKVFEINGVSLKTSVDLTDFYRGVYIFQLRDKSGRIVDSGKFQVSK